MVEKIISGGQTGADQAGLYAAKELGIKTGGYAPKGYKTATGSNYDLHNVFGLLEMDSSSYSPRTVANVHNSDGTVWFGNVNSPGGKLTIKLAHNMARPLLVNPETGKDLRNWIIRHKIKILNVAGNRESTHPGIFNNVKIFLTMSLKEKG